MRPWLAIPIVGVVAAAIAAALGGRGLELACAAAAGAAVVHALRAFAGDSPAAIAGACAGALLAVVTISEHAHRTELSIPFLALAAAAWTFAELARETATPYVALAPAITAAIIEPACVALVAIAGARLVGKPSRPMVEAALRTQLRTGESGQLPLPQIESGRHKKAPRPRIGLPRWVIAVPIAGAGLVLLAIITGTARDGLLGSLASSWYGPRVRDASPGASLFSLGDALGPLLVVAAGAGAIVLARVHLASLAVVACAIGAVLVDLRTGATGAFTVGLASLCAGAGISRFAGMIRVRSGQAITAATCGVLLLVPPVWTLIG